MGRRDAVQVTLEFAAEWRRLGARVTFEPGWETRGNGTSANYDGAVVHHTVGASSSAVPLPSKDVLKLGRVGLTGPLCNSAGPWCEDGAPWIHIMAAHPANHAGASGGKSMGPLPITSLFNPRVWGHEIDYLGDRPMTKGQYKSGLIVAAGVANVLARSTEYVRAHAETSITGKWDPGYAPGRTIDMAAFRRDAAKLSETGGDGLPVGAAEDLAEIKQMLRGGMNAAKGENNFHWIERMGRPYEVFRSDPDKGGNGTMALFHPCGVFYGIPDIGWFNLYITIGLCPPDYVNVHPDHFSHISDLAGLGRKASGVDVKALAAELDKLDGGDLPATPPVGVPMTEAQIEKLAGLLDDELADSWRAALAEHAAATATAVWAAARDGDPATGPVS